MNRHTPAPRRMTTLIALCVLVASCLRSTPTAPGFPDGTTRVLFIGNSLTYTNDLPGLFVTLARAAGHRGVDAAQVAFPDFALEDHWSEGTARRALREHRWEYVVLQQGSSALPSSQLHLRSWTEQFAPAIRSAGATPVLFMVWPMSTRAFDFPNVLTSYRNAAAAVGGVFAPAGDAWTAHGGMDVLYSDGLHPTVHGTYLAAAVLLERTLGIRPEDLPPTIPGAPGISEVEVRALQAAARVALDRNPALPGVAQVPDSAVLRATVARQAFQNAAAAASPAQSLAEITRAVDTWPAQPAYWQALARTAARLSDTLSLQRALARLVQYGTGAELLSDASVRRFSGKNTVGASLNALAEATAPLVAGRVIATITDTMLFAEGIDVDARTGTLFVSNIRTRTILAIDREGKRRDLQVGRHPRIGAVLGVRVTADGRHLFATTSTLPMMQGYDAQARPVHAILKLRAQDGALLARWDLPADGMSHTLGDLAIATDGSVMATDASDGALWSLPANASSATPLRAIRDPLLRSPQGITWVPGTRQLIVADYSHGLLAVDADAHLVTRLRAPDSMTTVGVDGIVWYDDGIVAVQNGVSPSRVVHFTVDHAQRAVQSMRLLDRQPTVATEPTIGTIWQDGFVYVGTSQWQAYDDQGARRRAQHLQPTVLVCVALRERQTIQLGTARSGTRTTTSVPPVSRTCSTRDAASP
ncbi:MAG: hypothetical protein IT353_12900 [Gemmatimonadaceae bacterium]|nr:hypothetical protein [Gemmatimonadaceae bacterium]